MKKKKFRKQLRKRMQEEFEDVMEDVYEEIEEVTSRFCQIFQSQLDDFINQKTQFLESLRQ